MQDSAGTRGLLSVLKKFYCHIGIPFLVSILTVSCFGFVVCFDSQSNLLSPHMHTFG